MGRRKSRSKLTLLSAVVPSPEIEALDSINTSVTLPYRCAIKRLEDRRFLLNLVQQQWSKALFWCAYEIAPSIDIARYPYNHADIREARAKGEYLYALLRLTKGCFELDTKLRQKNPHSNPIAVWAKAMAEAKAWHMWATCQNLDERPLTKQESESRWEVAQLRGGWIPEFDEGPPSPTHQMITASAQQLHKRLKGKAKQQFDTRYWESWILALETMRDTPGPTNPVIIGVANGRLVAQQGPNRWPYNPSTSNTCCDKQVRGVVIGNFTGTPQVVSIPPWSGQEVSVKSA